MKTGLPETAANLWEMAMLATGGHASATISATPGELRIFREGVLEAIFADAPPERAEVRHWIIQTAQRLGFPDRDLTENGSDRDPHRMTLEIPLEDFAVVIVGTWYDPRADKGTT